MVGVGEKAATRRRAVATALVRTRPDVVALTAKGGPPHALRDLSPGGGLRHAVLGPLSEGRAQGRVRCGRRYEITKPRGKVSAVYMTLVICPRGFLHDAPIPKDIARTGPLADSPLGMVGFRVD